MADLEVGNAFGLNIPEGAYDNPNLVSIAKMKAALTDHDAAYYTAEELNRMTYNDLVYALKVNNITTLPA